MNINSLGLTKDKAGGGWIPLLLLLLLALPQGASPKTWHVYANGSGGTETIQDAIDLAANNDTVLVHPGVYQVNLTLIGKDIVLKSVSGPEVTTLDGSQRGSVIVIREGVTSSAKICGFRIINGTGYALEERKRGGGIYIGRSWPIICHNHFEDNVSSGGGAIVVRNEEANVPLPDVVIIDNAFLNNRSLVNGGAVQILDVNTSIIQNRFIENSAAFDGGGISDSSGNVRVSVVGNIFVNNFAWDKGGAANFVSGASPGPVEFVNNTVLGNVSLGLDNFDAGSGGGIRVGGRSGVISHNTFVNNDGRSVSGASGGGISLGWKAQDIDISNNIFAYNQGSGIACFDLSFPNSIELGHNIFWQNDQGAIGTLLKPCPDHWDVPWEVDPQFCDWKNGDFSVTSTSPAIATGIVYGAYPDAKCGITVQTEQMTWGHLKVLFSTEN